MRNKSLKHFMFFSFVALWIVPSIISAAEVSIELITGAKGDERHTVSVYADSIASEISGFNLTIAYNQRQSYVLSASQGDLFDSCGWEYFTYRLISDDTVSAHLPSFDVHLLRVFGLASLSGSPPQSCNLTVTTLAEFEVLLRHIEGSFSDEEWIPFSFFWRDCNDNVLVSATGDSLFVASQLFEHNSTISPPEQISPPYPGFGFPDLPCAGPEGEVVVDNIDFVNSGIWSFVYDPVEECYRGDINLNGIHFELADVILFIQMFGIYCVLPCWPEEVIAQTDANCDSLVLSVADLVFMIRIIIGEESIPKPVPQVQLEYNPYLTINSSKKLVLNTETDVAAVFVRIYSKDGSSMNESELVIASPDAYKGQVGDTLNLLIADIEDNKVFAAGQNLLFHFSGESELEIVGSVVDVFGNETPLKLESVILPNSPALMPNYPNPFNPSTTIEFSLPEQANWKIEIYNISGQLINQFSGEGIGQQSVVWNGADNKGTSVSSGVYFYELITAKSVQSRKMMLLK